MIFKDSDGDLWRIRDGQLEVRLTLEGTGVDIEGKPLDEGWGPSYWDDSELADGVPETAANIERLRANPWTEADGDGDNLLDHAAAQRRMENWEESQHAED